MSTLIDLLSEYSTVLILVVAIIYTVVGIGNIIKGQYGLAITWICYALANVGLWLTEKGV